MFFNFGFKSTLLFVFFLHGVVFSVLLLIKGIKGGQRHDLWLSLFLLLSTLFITPFMLGYGGWYSRNPFRDVLFYVPFQQLLLLPPSLYFYTLTLLDRSFTFSRSHIYHFFPATAYLGYSIVIFIVDKLYLEESYFYSDGRDKDFDAWYQILGFISLLYYLTLSIRAYLKYKNIAYQTVSFAEEIKFSWVKRFLLTFLTILLLRAIFFIANPEWANFGQKFWYYVCFSILCYYISISGYINSLQSVITFKSDLPADERKATYLLSGQSVRESIINEREIKDLKELKTKVENIMSCDKVFRNPELTLAGLSTILGVNSKIASQVVNQSFGMNFNDYVNYHRTQEVIRLMNSNKPNLLTLLGIAFDCGFNSKSTFNRAFKKHTSLTPKAFLENIKMEKGVKS